MLLQLLHVWDSRAAGSAASPPLAARPNPAIGITSMATGGIVYPNPIETGSRIEIA